MLQFMYELFSPGPVDVLPSYYLSWVIHGIVYCMSTRSYLPLQLQLFPQQIPLRLERPDTLNIIQLSALCLIRTLWTLPHLVMPPELISSIPPNILPQLPPSNHLQLPLLMFIQNHSLRLQNISLHHQI